MSSTLIPEPPPIVDGPTFVDRLRIATYSVVLLVLIIYLLGQFRTILQPLFVAVFIGFLMHPIHRWLVKRGLPSLFSYGVILILVAGGLFAFGSIVYANTTEVARKVPDYEKRLEDMVRDAAEQLPWQVPDLDGHFLRKIHIDPEQLLSATRAGLGQFGDFTSYAALTFVYLLFLIAEQVSFPRRLNLALGPVRGEYIMGVVESINEAIGQYIAVKSAISALAGFLSYAVLASFGVDFAATWGILVFILNYIPYLGSLIAVTLPIVLSFVQFDEMWKGIVIAILLIAIQQVMGTLIEPRMAGRRLDISPLLILLALAFWGAIWGIVGMILAVPLLVIVKIILDNIDETKPLATLISNQ